MWNYIVGAGVIVLLALAYFAAFKMNHKGSGGCSGGCAGCGGCSIKRYQEPEEQDKDKEEIK